MFFELIATFVAGLAAAGIMMTVNRLTGRRLPRWVVPVAAGSGMILFTISNEYLWFNRTVATLPDGVEVAHTVEETAFYRPWTYAAPYVSRFVALDQLSKRTNDAFPDHRIFDLLIYGRWAPINRVRSLFDCSKGRRADLVDGVRFEDDGTISGVQWYETGLGDPVTKAACREG